MQSVKVDINNWKRSILVAVLLAFVHPAVNLANNLFAGQTISYALSKFWVFLTIWLIINLACALKTFFSNQIRQINADDDGLRIWTGHRVRRLSWSQIASMEHSLQTERNSPKQCLILRDAGGHELVRLCREIEQPQQLQTQWQQLESLITSKIGRRGVISSPMEGVPTQTSFVLRPRFKTLTFMGLFLWAPGSVLAWTDPRGGPIHAAGFAIAAIVCILAEAFEARYEVNELGVSTKNLFRRKFLAWNEIRRASTPDGPHLIHFESDKLSLELKGPADWGKDGALLMIFLQEQFARFGILGNADKALSWRDFFAESEQHQPEQHQPEQHQPEQHQPEQHQPEQHQPEQHQPEQHQPEQHQPEQRENHKNRNFS